MNMMKRLLVVDDTELFDDMVILGLSSLRSDQDAHQEDIDHRQYERFCENTFMQLTDEDCRSRYR